MFAARVPFWQADSVADLVGAEWFGSHIDADLAELTAAYAADWIDDTAQMELALAYVRRQRWIAKTQAVEIVTLLGEAMGGKRKPMGLGKLSMMGFGVRRGNG